MKLCYIKLNKGEERWGFSRYLILTVSVVLIFALIITSLGGADMAASAQPQTSDIIILDAGHGGEDPGAVGINGALEKDVNLSVALRLGEILKDNGFTVLYTRSEDKLLYKAEENIKGLRKISDLKNRVAFCEEYPGALFISLHMNSYGSEKYSGLQVYSKPQSTESKNLAEKIQSAVKENLQPDNKRQVKDGEGIFVLEKNSLESVLIECGFLTNAQEAERLSEKEYQNDLCFAIVCGIIEYTEEIKYRKEE